MADIARSVAESGIPLVEVILADRAEFERGLFTQGFSTERAAEIAHTIGANDAALQMLARHRIAALANCTPTIASPDNWQRFQDGNLKPFLPPSQYADLRDDDRFLYNCGPRPEGLV